MGRNTGFLSRMFAACAIAGAVTLSAVAPVHAGPFLAGKFAAPSPSAARDICDRYSWACSQSGQKTSLTKRDLDLIKSVNLNVNKKTRAIDDRTQYRRTEHWALPTKRGGDCEDFALLKKHELIKRGIAPERLLIATVLDRNRNGHAVLVVRTDEEDLVLDNLTNRIKPWKETRYTFLLMQNPLSPASWVGVLEGG